MTRLNQMATAGGRPRPVTATSPAAFYLASTQADLTMALQQITGQVASCVFELTPPPPVPDNIAVDFNGQRTPHDPTRMNGWEYTSADHTSLQVYGSYCDKIKTEAMNAVEINSSFYRPHQPQTYERWAASTPAGFRFAVKCPKQITHEARLEGAEDALARFVGEAGALGGKWAVLLVQLPPSLRFDTRVAGRFFEQVRAAFGGATLSAVGAEHDAVNGLAVGRAAQAVAVPADQRQRGAGGEVAQLRGEGGVGEDARVVEDGVKFLRSIFGTIGGEWSGLAPRIYLEFERPVVG